MRIAIVGAGIGGLTAALALRDAGFEPTLYEQSDRLTEVGAGLQLGANATQVLIRLGLHDALRAVVVRPTAVHLRSWRSGRVVAERPLGDANDARYGAPYYHVHRADLQALLIDAVRAAGIPLHLGHRLCGLDDDGTRVRLDFSVGGERAVGDHSDDSSPGVQVDAEMCLGADGIHSTVHRLLHAPGKPRFTGNLAWRACVPLSEVPAELHAPLATVWMGPHAHLVHYLLQGGRSFNIVAVAERSDWTREDWRDVGDPDELRARFAGWHPLVQAALRAVRTCHLWALHDRDPLPRWSRGGATLLGDACHPMLPFLAQGAAMAIEDAWVLARLLRRTPADPRGALQAYEAARLPRTARVQREARAQATLFHHDGAAALARDARLGLGSRLLPGVAMAHYDWLYGYATVGSFT